MSRVAEYFFRSPWAVKENLFEIMQNVIVRHVSGEKLSNEEIQALKNKDSELRPGFEVVNGVARIPVTGIIAKYSSMVNNTSQPMGTSTEQITDELMRCLSDDKVKMIALDIDSPGGSVSGVQELSDLIYSSRKKKPIYAYASGMMCSAAYWIGSAAEKVFSTRSTEVGSIGVYASYYDFSVRLHNLGIKPTVFKAGENKAAGHPDVPMTESDKNVIQEEINKYYDLFVKDVARNRGISFEAAKKLANGRVWIGEEAAPAGLVDGMAVIDSIFSSGQRGQVSAASAAAAPVNAGEEQRSAEEENQTEKTEEIEMAELKTLTSDELRVARPDLALAFVNEGKQVGNAEGRTAAEAEAAKKAEAETARVKAIFAKAAEVKDVPLAAIEKAITGGESVELAEKSMKAAKLDAVGSAHHAPMGAGNSGEEDEKASKDHLSRATEYRKTHGGTMEAALKATDDKKRKVRA